MQRTARPPEKKIPERALILAERFLIDATEMRSCPLRVVAELLPLFASAPLLDLPPGRGDPSLELGRLRDDF